jgi:NADH-quinone oxidoreductase subunit L
VWIFGPRREIPITQPASQSFLTVAGRNDLYGDAFNEAVFMRPGQQLTEAWCVSRIPGSTAR